MVNFTLRSTTNEMISISTSQTFRSWVVIFHLRQPMEFLSLNLYDTPGLAPRMNVLYWGPGDFPVSYSNRGYLTERLKSSFRKFYGRYGDLIQQYEVSLSRMLNDILILDQQWLPNQSDFPPISWPWYRAWPSPIMSGFHGAFATGVACQQGTLTLPDTWFRPPFWDLLMLQLLRPNSSNLPCLYSTFHFEYPLVLSRFCSIYCPHSLNKVSIERQICLESSKSSLAKSVLSSCCIIHCHRFRFIVGASGFVSLGYLGFCLPAA